MPIYKGYQLIDSMSKEPKPSLAMPNARAAVQDQRFAAHKVQIQTGIKITISYPQ
jgi:hypothetical protein